MPDIILYGYPASPYYQKVQHFLHFLKLDYRICPQPNVLPRPDFAAKGITYRRIPLLSIDGDMYADSGLIVARLCQLAEVRNDLAMQLVGQGMFGLAAALIPYKLLADPVFLKDRAELTGTPWTEQSIAKGRTPALSAMLVQLDILQRLLEGREFLDGNTLSTSDLHVFFVVNWALQGHRGGSPEISPESHPTIYAWLERVGNALPKVKSRKISFAEAEKALAGRRIHVEHVNDPLGFKQGMHVSVVPIDTGRAHPQVGTLHAINPFEVVLDTHAVRLHFPRSGYRVSVAKL
jgi:glutathione S-transferase